MFTGIIEEIGKVKNIKFQGDSLKISIEAKNTIAGLKIGDSVSVNGVCLSIVDISKNVFSADLVDETIKKSTLPDLVVGDLVNLERAVRADSLMSGHIVTGHIDTIGVIKKIIKTSSSTSFEISVPRNIKKFIVPKGSITVDGISLTVGEVFLDTFKISIIPLTSKKTTIASKNIGASVNVEVDILSKYVSGILQNTEQDKKNADRDVFDNVIINDWLGGFSSQWN